MLRNNADARRCSYFELGLPVVVTVVLFCFCFLFFCLFFFFWGGVVVIFFLLSVKNSRWILCFKANKIWNYHKFCLVMINCYSWLNKSDSSYVVSWLHSVLFPLLTIQVLKLSFKWLLLLLSSSSSSLLLLFLALCTGWSHTVVLAKGASHDPWKRTLTFRLLTLELTNTFL